MMMDDGILLLPPLMTVVVVVVRYSLLSSRAWRYSTPQRTKKVVELAITTRGDWAMLRQTIASDDMSVIDGLNS